LRKYLAPAVIAALLVAGCTSGESTSEGSATDGTTEGSAAPTGPAPGVSADAVKVGITYADLASIRELTNIDHGDYEASYQVLIDEINAAGGINGRTIEPIFAPVNPVGTAPAEEACVRLTQDEQVFLAMGYFQQDAVLCYVETNATAALGGVITPERLARARAPWFSTEASADLELEAVRVLAAEGELDGNVAVVATLQNETALRQEIEPLLDELGIEPVEVGVIDAPEDDVAAQNAAVGVLAERFRAAGADTVLVTGESGLTWANGVEQTDYRPQLAFTNVTSIEAYTQDAASRDLSVVEGAVAAAQLEAYDEANMQACIDTIGNSLGIDIVDPATVPEGEPNHFVAASSACRNVPLMEALLGAAGEDLNYGTLAAGAEGLEVEIPGYPEPFVYGPDDAADGDQAPELFEWDPQSETFTRIGA
jgi:hypothetical protein